MSVLAKSLEGGFVHEDVEVQRGADHFCAAPGGDGHTGGQGLPEAGDLGADIFPVEEKVWGAQNIRAPSLETARGGEQAPQAHVADLSLDKQVLQDVLSKKFLSQPRSVST